MKIFLPTNIKEFLEIKSKEPDAIILAGGTDLLAQWHNNKIMPNKIISISMLKNLSFIKEENNFVEIGSLTNHATIESNKIINKYLPILATAASTIGAPAIRNMGTIGGNIANASPAADLAPALLVYDAIVKLTSMNSTRELKLSEFYRGYKQTALGKDELIFSIKIPLPPQGVVTEFFKIGTRRAQSIAKVSLAGLIKKEKKGIDIIRLAAGSVAPTPIRLYELEKFLQGKILTRSVISTACDILQKYIKPITDVRSTEEYRRIALKNILVKFLSGI
ncbi:MAG: xanthine dehydrogenase family protein subunit M [Deltaproteobacteria bacterium]|nr:xanthine dehydrogenase family protein subunit M [Deltaproteobacteria bacterium]